MLNKLICLLILPLFIVATEYSPWLGKDFVLETRLSCLYQNYHRVQADRTLHRSANDLFFDLSGSLTALDYGVEVEAIFAKTHRQRPACDQFRLTGRYRMSSDIASEDCYTMTPGITLIQAFEHSVHDPSSFHHGKLETELHVAIGKESSCGAFWQTRRWALFAAGFADVGSPWIRANFYWEKNWWDQQQLRLFAHTLWGFGHNDIHTLKHFHGYGSIRHQSIDLGVRYDYLFECGWTFGLQYARRVYAHNFPQNANLVMIQLEYPIGLGL